MAEKGATDSKSSTETSGESSDSVSYDESCPLYKSPKLDTRTGNGEDTGTGNAGAEVDAASPKDNRVVSIVLAGCSKAGKSTLAARLLGNFDEEQDMSAAKPITKKHSTKQVIKNGVTLKVTDTVSLEERGRRKVLRKLSKHAQRKADLLVYCLPVGPNSRFAPGNPAAMRSLQEAYGKGIWDHCIVALTFSNLALDWLGRRHSSEEEIGTKYRAHLLQHAALFHQELRRLGVRKDKVKLFAGYLLTPEGIQTIISAKSTTEEDEVTTTGISHLDDIEAIPTGNKPEDDVLPITDPLKTHTKNWHESLYDKMIEKCDPHPADHKRKLLHYRYGAQIRRSLRGVALGAGVRAFAGALGGPLGVGVREAVGGIVGTGVAGTGRSRS